MMTSKEFIFTIICLCNAVHINAQYQQYASTFWRNVKPGELLHSLDAITSGAQSSTQPFQLAEELEKQPLIQANISVKARVQRRVNRESNESTEDSKSLEKETAPYNYDQAYDEFVKKYFEDSVTDALSNSESAENKDASLEVETYSGEELDASEENDPITEASKKSTKTEKCKRISRGRESCLVCKNPRNGETSENCSFNKETKPQSYAFEKQKNYRKYRENPKDSNTDDSSHEMWNEKQAATLKKPIKIIQKSNDTSSSCVKKVIKNKICYHCENNNGEKMTKCYDEKPETNSKDDKKKFKKSHHRIYKRTVSYTYENSPYLQSNEDDKVKQLEDVLENPLIKKQIHIEELKENDSHGV